MKNKNSNKNRTIMLLLFIISIGYFWGQVRIAVSSNNPSAPNSSAFIDASSNTEYNNDNNLGKGLLYPRTDLTLFNTFGGGAGIGIPNNYPNYYDGFMVYNTATNGVAGVGSTEGTLCRGFWYYENASGTINGGTWRPFRSELCTTSTIPSVKAINCESRNISGILTQDTSANGIVVVVPYSGGNGLKYLTQLISSTGVTGLTAILPEGRLANGDGNLVLSIIGKPTSSGIASFNISIGGQSCVFTVPVNPSSTSLFSLDCTSTSVIGNLVQGTSASGVFVTLPYTGGNGTTYSKQSISSRVVSGLTATLQAGTFANGNGQLTYEITGIPSSTGVASFDVNIGGQSCTLNVYVNASGFISAVCDEFNVRLVAPVRANVENFVYAYVSYPPGKSGVYSGYNTDYGQVYNHTNGNKGTLGVGLNAGVYNPAGGEFEYFISGKPYNPGGLVVFYLGTARCALTVEVQP